MAVLEEGVTPAQVRAGDVGLGAVVRATEGPFGSAIVRQIADGRVHLFRPYATTADFAYTGGVIPYIGIEEMTVGVDQLLTVLQAAPKLR